MNVARLVALIVFMLALGGVVMVVIWAAPWAGDEPAQVAAPDSPKPRPTDTSLEEPLDDFSPSPTPTGKRLFEVCAWSRGSGPSLTRALRAGAIDEVDFDWYHSRSDGSLKPEGENLALVRRAQDADVRALMTVTNRKNHLSPFDPKISAAILATPGKRSRHVDVLVKTCLDKGYDGVDMDWEMMDVADRDAFSEFVEELGRKLHAEKKLLSIAVFPKTSEPGDWDSQKSEDYKRLGAAVDEFKVMTYSYSGPWGEPGPQTPLDWASEVLDFAQTQVPPRKVYMGVPFFGFDWSGGTATTVYARNLEKLQEKYLLETRRDKASGELVVTYTDDKRKKHTIYLTDTRALKIKLDLLVKDHPKLAGIAIWVMDKEEQVFWETIARRLAE